MTRGTKTEVLVAAGVVVGVLAWRWWVRRTARALGDSLTGTAAAHAEGSDLLLVATTSDGRPYVMPAARGFFGAFTGLKLLEG